MSLTPVASHGLTLVLTTSQAAEDLDEAQAQLASAQAAMDELRSNGQPADDPSGQPPLQASGPALCAMGEHPDVTGASDGAAPPAAPALLRLRCAELQNDRDGWQRRAERASAETAALREHLTAVCADGRRSEAALLNAQQASRDGNAHHLAKRILCRTAALLARS